MSLKSVGEHLHETAESIRGPMNPVVWQSLSAFYAAQQERGYEGPVAEIGVHHGKFFISLLKVAAKNKPSYAFDIFDMQENNVDASGKGDLDILKENIRASGLDIQNVRFVRGDSLQISSADINKILTENGRFSFFSVDGGHTAEHTVNDLEIAMALTDAEGIIVVDDYYNPNWPGVQEGIIKYFAFNSPPFVPILYSANKLFLCHLSRYETYLQKVPTFLRQTFPKIGIKIVDRCGYRGFSVRADVSRPDPRTWF